MNGSFSAQAVRIGDLLSGTAIYAMPGFQRPYAWTREEVARLLDDLLYGVNDADLQPGSRSVLFLGTIVLIETAQSTATPGGAARNQRFDVVDGQQRLITLALIFAAVRDLGNRLGSTELAERMDRLIAIHGQQDSDVRTYRIGVRAKDTDVLVNFVQQMDGCLAEADPDEFEGEIGRAHV